MSQVKLSPAEQRVYDLICQSDARALVQKGLIEVYKKNVSPYRVRKIKFLRKK
jgi:ribosomal protein L19E